MMTNITQRVIYTGVTSDLISRVQEHKYGTFQKSFTSKYNCRKLVYYYVFSSIQEAIIEEKRIKGLSRSKKEVMIASMNAGWIDLWDDIKVW